MTYEELVEQVLLLPPAERGLLARDLLKSLPQEGDDESELYTQAEVDAAQAALAKERLAACERGESSATDAFVLIEELQRKFEREPRR